MDDNDDRRDEQDRLGQTAAVLRRSKHLSQQDVAEKIEVCRTRVSDIETGKEATAERVEEIARRIGYHTLHVLKTRHLIEFLADEQRKPFDPLGPTPDQEVIVYEAGRELATRFETIVRDVIRRGKLKRARQTAAAQWKRVKRLAPSRMRAEIRSNAELHTWAFCDHLCSESVRQAVRDPRAAIAIGRLAVIAARRCADLLWVDRLVAYAFAHLANAFRVAGMHFKADRLFTRADRLWSSSAADPGVLDPGRIVDLKASLRKDQRRLPEALVLLERAFTVSRVPGRILVNRALTLSLMGSYEDAIATLRRADELLVEREPRDEFIINLNMGVSLCHLERFDEADVLAQAAYGIAEASGNRIDLLRSFWLRARVLAGRGDRKIALSIYEILRHDFEEFDMTYDLALVSLELAALLLSRPNQGMPISRRRAPLLFQGEGNPQGGPGSPQCVLREFPRRSCDRVARPPDRYLPLLGPW